EREPGQRGLASLEGEHAVRIGIEKVGIHQPFERFAGHAPGGQRLVWVGVAVQVEAVGAVEVADGRSRLDQQGTDARRGPQYRQCAVAHKPSVTSRAGRIAALHSKYRMPPITARLAG